MTLTYRLLGESQAEHLRKQRLLDLEADHYRFLLDLEELPEGVEPPPDLMTKLSDVEYRIQVHSRALGLASEITSETPSAVSPSVE